MKLQKKTWLAYLVLGLVLAVALFALAPQPAAASEVGEDYQAYKIFYKGFRQADASGQAVIVERADGWRVKGWVADAEPGSYTMALGIAGVCAPYNTPLVTFNVGADGTGSFTAMVDELPDTWDFSRIYYEGEACLTQLSGGQIFAKN